MLNPARFHFVHLALIHYEVFSFKEADCYKLQEQVVKQVQQNIKAYMSTVTNLIRNVI